VAELFNSNFKHPIFRMESFDGSIKLGFRGDALEEQSDFLNIADVTQFTAQYDYSYVTFVVTMEILYGAWIGNEFEDVVRPLVEETSEIDPIKVQELRNRGENLVAGLWKIQFGWFDEETGLENVTQELLCWTKSNTVVADAKNFGSVTLQKTLGFTPALYMMKTSMRDMTETMKLLTLERNNQGVSNEDLELRYLRDRVEAEEPDPDFYAGVDLGPTPAQQPEQVEEEVEQPDRPAFTDPGILVTKDIFTAIARDLQRIYKGFPNVPDVDSFTYLGTNLLNTGAFEAYRAWIEEPLVNVSALLSALDTQTNADLNVYAWVDSWLQDNNMQLIPQPFRVLSSRSKAGFIIRFAEGAQNEFVEQFYQANNADSADTRDADIVSALAAFSWQPTLDVASRAGILENVSFQTETGKFSFLANQQDVEFQKKVAGLPDSREEGRSSDAADDTTSTDIRSVYYELLRTVQKTFNATLQGQPDLAAGDVLRIDVNNPLFNGYYQVDSVSHAITRGGFNTDVSGFRLQADLGKQIKGLNDA